MKPRLYLVDAHAYLHRAYHALPPLTDPRGRPAGALYGFARMLLQLVRRDKPEGLAVCFDLPGPTFRHRAYAAYKATRKELDADLAEQLPRARPLAEALGLACIEAPDYEADDVMATMARKAVEAGWQAVLVTGDKDALQLVREGVRVFNAAKGDWLDSPEVEAKLGVPPAQVVDYLAVVGDAADNVPGVKGVGPVGAVKLLKAYGTLREAVAAAERGEAGLTPKLAAALLGAREGLDRSYGLLRLDDRVELSASPEDCLLRPVPPGRAAEGLEEFGFRSLLRELEAGPGAAAAAAEAPAPASPAAGASAARPGEGSSAGPARAWKELAGALAKAEEIFVAARPGSPQEGELLASSRVRLALGDGDGRAALLGEEEARSPAARAALEGSALKTGWDLKAARRALDGAGLSLSGPFFDFKLAAYCLDPGSAGDPKAAGSDEDLLERAARCRGREEALRRLGEAGVRKLFEEVEAPLEEILLGMERAGIAVDGDALRRVGREFEESLRGLQAEIDALAGGPLNPQSPKQLGEALFDRLGLPVVHKTAKGGRSTDEETLTALAARHALPGKVLEFRELAKLRSTYVEGLLARLDPSTGRVHTTFDQTGTLTGRLSSLDPNLQNIPVRTEAGRRIRRAFVAPPGRVLVSADYSQIDLRVLAHESGDETLTDSFRRGEDIHRRTASEIFRKPPQAVTSEERRAAKAVNFGIVYGQTAFGLAAQLGVPQAEAAAYIKGYLERYPGVSAWAQENLERARREGCARTLLGRVRWLPDLKAKNAAVRQFTERAARNTPIQGGSADIIKLAMLAVDRGLGGRGARLLLQVHDELLFEAEAPRAADFAAWVKGVMEGACRLKVPLAVDIKIGPNWRDMEAAA